MAAAAVALARVPAACGHPRSSLAGHLGPSRCPTASPILATPWMGSKLAGFSQRARLQTLQTGTAGSSSARPPRIARFVAETGQTPGVETAPPASKSEEQLLTEDDATTRSESRDAAKQDGERESEEVQDNEAGREEKRERQRRAEQAGVSGSEDGTAPGNGIGRATLLAFSVRQNLLILGGRKDKGDSNGKDTGTGKGDGKEKGDKPEDDQGEGSDYVRGLGRQKTLQERTDEKRVRNKEAIQKAKAGMKARGEQKGMSMELWSEEKQTHWEQYRHARAAFLKERESQKPKFTLESYADPNEMHPGERLDPAGPNVRTHRTENGILSEEERQRLQPIAKPPPDPVYHKVGKPFKGEWGINVNSAGWAPGNPNSPDTGSHRGQLNKYGEVATAFPYGTWIGERHPTTFEAAPLNNNSPYYSLNHRPTVTQSVTITQHKASNHVKGGERATSSLAGLCNPANKLPPRDGIMDIHRSRPRNRLVDESIRSRGVTKASYEGQSDEEMYGLREGTLPDSLNVIRKTRDAAEWMAKDSPVLTELSLAQGRVTLEYKNAIVEKMHREKMADVNPLLFRRMGDMAPLSPIWSFEAGNKTNKEEYELAKEQLQYAIEQGEDEGYIRMKEDQVDMLGKRVEQERRTLPGKVESLTVV